MVGRTYGQGQINATSWTPGLARRAPVPRPPPSPEAQVRSTVARSMKSFLQRYSGITLDSLLKGAGIDPAVLGDPEGRLTLARTVELLRLASHETHDPCFGIDFGAQLPLRDLGVVGYIMRHSPTLGAALDHVSRYYQLQQTSGGLALRTGKDGARVTFALSGPGVTTDVQHAQVVFATLVQFARSATGIKDWAPRGVDFAHGSRGERARYDRVLGVPTRFDQRENAIILSPADLERPLLDAEPDLFPILHWYAEDGLARLPLPVDLAGQVRRLVIQALDSGDVTLEDVAERMRTSARTLQRRLQEVGQPFQAVVAQARLELARTYLDDPSLSLTEIAFRLGYSDLSAFSRAFRRWTGSSPLEFRRRPRA